MTGGARSYRCIALGALAVLGLGLGLGLTLATSRSLQPLPDSFEHLFDHAARHTFLDRHGQPLNITYQNRWNLNDRVYLHQVPEFLQNAFIVSEDKRFFAHRGVDWIARAHALVQNLLAGDIVRGASTLSEQVVRMLHPRPRTPWSRWLEGFEAAQLERRFSKLDIFEFYLNQVPYGANRRGIAQAAAHYFDRDISTLSEREMLALAVLVRAPRWLDPQRRAAHLDSAIADLAARTGTAAIERQPLQPASGQFGHNLEHFLQFASTRVDAPRGQPVDTTVDIELQQKVQRILDTRLQNLAPRHVQNGAALVVDHHRNQVIAWAVGHAGRDDMPYNQLNAVVVRRQPGSALKPLLYAAALARGWTAATMLEDMPLEEGVGPGMHTYHNYSRIHYGPVSLREALGNSLNIPAVRTVQYLGAQHFLDFLHRFGFTSLAGHPNVYGDGLALGNGEVTLFELVQAYAVLARMGDFKPLTLLEHRHRQTRGRRVLSEDVASLIADILSDPGAREKEFGRDSILNFPYQTAVKTGTSSDYRDAWAIGYNDRYTVGVWIGNLDYSAMHKVTGATGPAQVLRSVVNELNRNRDVRPLYFSEKLVKKSVCVATGAPAQEDCRTREEWFVPGTSAQPAATTAVTLRLRKPSPGLLLAMDPRIPDSHEYFEFAVTEADDIRRVDWFVNDTLVATTAGPRYAWPLRRGQFTARAEVITGAGAEPVKTAAVSYRVH
ncbi:penicillin-binding protein [Exilibacterium tricleocarpae]|uniref:peptidoglycan glycosyltransferase n=1 Tax=Exilibacterium tricleocarpae TaxID=2591008 RepID=A0A545SNE5_9GAMM|nr:transglycosylase domain-containing protein [Exilibacterium tricleocarpae]TQV66503.1 penicillin-binding protein [Exilibacterium tricleocarpae]